MHGAQANAIEPPGPGGGREEGSRFGLSLPGSGSVGEKLLSVFEGRRDLRQRQMCAVGCAFVVCVDFCKSSGTTLGDKGSWQVSHLTQPAACAPTSPLMLHRILMSQMLVTNEENNLIGSLVTDNPSITATLHFLKQLKKRANFNAKVCIIDNVPPSWNLDTLSQLEKEIQQALGVEWVGQDRFHVDSSFTRHFNNMHPRFYALLILKFRQRTTFRSSELDDKVARMLLGGQITKECKVRGVKLKVLD